MAFRYIDASNFFQTWLHTFPVRGRGFSESTLLLSPPPFAVAVVRTWPGRGERRAGAEAGGHPRTPIHRATALAAAAVCIIAAMLTQDQVLTVVFLTLTYGAITFQQSGVFGVCLDIGGPRAGAIIGLMNTVAQIGGLVGSVLYGYIVARAGYDAPFIPMAVVLCIGAALWLMVDASEKLGEDTPDWLPAGARTAPSPLS